MQMSPGFSSKAIERRWKYNDDETQLNPERPVPVAEERQHRINGREILQPVLSR
jgi:hypothetical protein